jgi:hypothetical protein
MVAQLVRSSGNRGRDMGDVEDRIPDLRERRSFLLHDLEDMSRGARFFRNDGNITDKM